MADFRQEPYTEGVRGILGLFKDTYQRWSRSNAPFLAAGLSYFTVFSLAPLMILVIAIGGFLYGQKAAEGALVQQISGFISPYVAEAIQGLLVNARQSGIGSATAVSVFLLFLGASQVFKQLQIALNMIWEVAPKPGLGFRHSVWGFLKKQLIAYGMVLSLGLLLLVLYFVDAGLSLFKNTMGNWMPFLDQIQFWKLLNFGISFVLLTILTAAIYEFLPETNIAWKDVWVGALFTSLLITAGRNLINLYFRFTNIDSVYGVAGSVVIIFVGIYFSAQIFLFGAEFTWSYANTYGSRASRAQVPTPA